LHDVTTNYAVKHRSKSPEHLTERVKIL
jgi:hypothetical protein